MADVQLRGTPVADAPHLDAGTADALVAAAPFLASLDTHAPWLDAGPRDGDQAEQHWFATRRPEWVPPAPERLAESGLLTVDAATDRQLLATASPLGLWTSTGTGTVPGMWRIFVEQHHDDALWRPPWRTWRCSVAPHARIVQVRGAGDWADLVGRHHAVVDGLLRPDWRAIGRTADAVHFSPRAVCAIDGFVLPTPAGPVAPTYRSVECTLWLRWAFQAVELVGTDPPQRQSAQNLDE